IKIYSRAGQLLKTVKQFNLKPFAIKFNATEDSLIVIHAKTIYFLDLATGKKTMVPYEAIGNFNEEGIAPAQKSYGSFYFLDKNGNPLNTKSYSSIINFSEGVAGVQDKTTEPPYLVDRSFNKIASLTTTFYGPYSEGLAKSTGPTGTSINYLDKKGNIVFTLNASDGLAFKEGRAAVKDINGKWYFVDKHGKTITKELYQNAAFFSQGLAAVQKNDKWGYIDTVGNVVIPFKFDG